VGHVEDDAVMMILLLSPLMMSHAADCDVGVPSHQIGVWHCLLCYLLDLDPLP
jgi:hypothetical protein